jgi:tetratricopeptide (TPR) repeat protein
MSLSPFKVGDRVDGHWDILKIIRGGMGIVYVVFDDRWREAFAAKTFQDEVFARDPETANRFVLEARSWLNLDAHQNVVRAHFVERVHEKPFLFLEYVSGGDLSGWIGTPRLTQDLRQVLLFAMQFCDGMIHALSKGIQAHRDIKPQNALVTENRILKVTDFGLARIFDDTSLEETHDAGSSAGLGIVASKSGRAAGTCTHMAPEQFEDAKHVDVRADIYSFGVMLFQMVRGSLPFQGRTWEELAHLHRTAPPPPLQSGQSSLDAVLPRCLAKTPAERYPEFGALRGELGSIFESMTGQPAPISTKGRTLEAYELHNKGTALANLGRNQEALTCYDRALAIDPHLVESWSSKGVSLSKLGRAEEAVVCIDRALGIKPDDSKAWFNKGVALGVLGRMEEAIACYDRALEISPQDDGVLYNKGIALRDVGRTEEALACFDRVLALNPRDSKAWSHKGLALGRLGRYEERLSCMERALALDPQFSMNWSYKGIALAGLSRYGEALECCDRALAMDAQYDEAWTNKALVLAKSGRYQEALPFFDHALSLNPKDATTWSNKALTLEKLGRPVEALVGYERVLSLNPRDPSAWDDKGLVLASLNRAQEALACFDAAIGVAPEFASGWYHKGVVLLYGFKNACRAIPCFEEAGRLGESRAAEKIAECRKSIGGWDEVNKQIVQFYQKGQFAEALPFAQEGLRMAESTFGTEHLNVATSLNILAAIYFRQDRLAESEPLYKRALMIREKALGPEHPDVAYLMTNLATVYDHQGRDGAAEELYRRALSVEEKASGPNQLDLVRALNELALFYEKRKRYSDSEPLRLRAIAQQEKVLGPEHPDLANSLLHLAVLYQEQSRAAEAEALMKRASSLREKAQRQGSGG